MVVGVKGQAGRIEEKRTGKVLCVDVFFCVAGVYVCVC